MIENEEIKRSRSIWAALWDNDFLFPLIVVLASFILGALLMLISGVNPLIAYQALFEASFGSLNSISETMAKACPLLLCGLGTIVAFRCKFWNIGAEGQIYAGGIAAALVGSLPLNLPGLVHIPLMILAGAAGGALFAFIPTSTIPAIPANPPLISPAQRTTATGLIPPNRAAARFSPTVRIRNPRTVFQIKK